MNQAQAKTYDYKTRQVQDLLVATFKRRRNEATVSDLVADTGLPAVQVETEIKNVSDEYGARLRVTESGEILYSFPDGMKSRYRGFAHSLGRFLRGSKEILKKVLAFLFKIWIVVMLVGYFVLFVALLVLAIVASFAAQASSKESNRGRSSRGGGGGALLVRLVEGFIRIWMYGELFKSPGQRQREREKKRPLHKAVFSFVFGDGDPNADWEGVERRAVLSFLRANRGVMTLEEFMIVTGLSPRDAESKINRYMLEFAGSPEVSDDGVVYYSFPEIMKSSSEGAPFAGLPSKRLWAFSSNPKKDNAVFAAINGFNLALGGYFLFMGTIGFGLIDGRSPFAAFYVIIGRLLANFLRADPTGLMLAVLGLVPFVFSLLFWLVPFLRSLSVKKANKAIAKEGARRAVYRAVWAGPERVGPGHPAFGAQAAPRDAGADPGEFVRELASCEEVDVPEAAPEALDFVSVARAKASIASVRAAIDPKAFELGETAFDTHE